MSLPWPLPSPSGGALPAMHRVWRRPRPVLRQPEGSMTMTQQPALVVGQVWTSSIEPFHRRMRITNLTSEAIWWTYACGRVPLSFPMSWTAWRDWQQRHDARVMEGGEGE